MKLIRRTKIELKILLVTFIVILAIIIISIAVMAMIVIFDDGEEPFETSDPA